MPNTWSYETLVNETGSLVPEQVTWQDSNELMTHHTILVRYKSKVRPKLGLEAELIYKGKGKHQLGIGFIGYNGFKTYMGSITES